MKRAAEGSFAMLRRLFLCLVLLPLLSACVLESAEPLIADKDGVLALAGFGDTLIAYGKSEAGDWKKEEDGKLSLRVEDNHYKIWDGNNTMLVTFVPLGEPWWGIQAKMGEECYTYVLAEINQGELILHENGCSEIEKVPGLGGTVDFSGGDCKAKPGADWRAMFDSLKSNPPPASMMLKPQG